MTRPLARRLLALALPFAVACGASPVATPLPPEARIEETTFAPSLGIDLTQFTRTESGVYYKDLAVGTSDSSVAVGKEVEAHYIGWLPDGTVFDVTSPDFPPYKFSIGGNSPIRGFQEGVLGMRVGGRRIIIIPPSLAYGYQGSPPRVPGNTVILFRVDVYAIR